MGIIKLWITIIFVCLLLGTVSTSADAFNLDPHLANKIINTELNIDFSDQHLSEQLAEEQFEAVNTVTITNPKDLSRFFTAEQLNLIKSKLGANEENDAENADEEENEEVEEVTDEVDEVEDVAEEEEESEEDNEEVEIFDLSDYPEMFMENGQFNGNIVIGENASAMDNLAANDIAVDLQSRGYRIPVDSVKLDSEIADVTAQDLIIVGNACVNSVAAELLGNPSECTAGLIPGQGRIKLIQHENGNYALLVYGYSAAETRMAAQRLINAPLEIRLEVGEISINEATINIYGPCSFSAVMDTNEDGLVDYIKLLEDELKENSTKGYALPPGFREYEILVRSISDEKEVFFVINGLGFSIKEGEVFEYAPREEVLFLIKADHVVLDSTLDDFVQFSIWTSIDDELQCPIQDNQNEQNDQDNDGIADTVDNCPLHANPAQTDSDSDKLGDACDQPANNQNNGQNNNNPLQTYEEQYETIQEKWEEYEDDYNYLKGKYVDAIDDEDKDDIDRYEDKLKELKDDLEDLEDEIDELREEIEENDQDNDSLLDDLEELDEGIKELSDKVKRVLSGESDDEKEDQTVTSISTLSNTAQQRQSTSVIIEPLDVGLLPTTETGSSQIEEKTSSWDDIRSYVWVGAGMVILLAVIIFLIALLLI